SHATGHPGPPRRTQSASNEVFPHPAGASRTVAGFVAADMRRWVSRRLSIMLLGAGGMANLDIRSGTTRGLSSRIVTPVAARLQAGQFYPSWPGSTVRHTGFHADRASLAHPVTGKSRPRCSVRGKDLCTMTITAHSTDRGTVTGWRRWDPMREID